MTCWKVLHIDPTIDIRRIKRAYAQLLRQYHPEEDPEGFQKLRTAFEEAMEQSKYLEASIRSETESASTQIFHETAQPVFKETEETLESILQKHGTENATPETMATQAMDLISGLYADFTRRRDPMEWKAAFTQLDSWPVDAKLTTGLYLFGFLSSNPWIPPVVWAMASDFFSWPSFAQDLYKYFPEDRVNHALWRIQNCYWFLGFEHIPDKKDVDYDTYLQHRDMAFHAILRDDLEEARARLEQAEAQLSGDPELMRLKVLTHTYGGMFDKALFQAEQWVKSHSSPPDAWLYLAHFKMDHGDFSGALSALSHLTPQGSDSSAVLMALARCHLSLGHLFEAKNLLEDILAASPNHIEAQMETVRVCHMLSEQLAPELTDNRIDLKNRLLLAGAYFQAGMPEEAETALGDDENLKKEADACLLRARILERLDRLDQAGFYYNLAQETAEEKGENQFQQLLYRGIFHYKQNDFHLAITDLEQVKQLSLPDIHPEAWFYLAESHRMVDSNDEALSLFNQLINEDNMEMKYYQHRAHTLFDMKRYELALEDYKTSVEGYYYSHGRTGIAKCLVEMKQYDEGFKAIEEAEKFSANDGIVAYYRARCAYGQEAFEDARDYIEKAIQYDENALEYNRLAAYIHMALDDEDGAVAYFVACKAIDNHKPYYGMLAANYCIKRDQLDTAVSVLEKCLGDIRRNSTILLKYGQDPELLLALADTTFIAGDPGLSLRYITLYFEKMEEKEKIPCLRAYFIRGRARYASENSEPDQCIPDLLKALESPDCPRAPYYLGMAYFDLQDFPNAQEYASQAICREMENKELRVLAEGIVHFKYAIHQNRGIKPKKAFYLWGLGRKEPLVTLKKLPSFYE